ncbi:MAG: ISAzo13 family transposase, partial [Nocardiopsaceae bacterium]|nr:ISAzo13 family transposase [Nocardiopsaceae bacterium]
ALEPGRARRPGAGRPTAEERQPGLKRALEGLLEEGKRGDPVSEITWSILSLRDIAARLAVLGFPVSKDTVAGLMRAAGWSLQGMSRVLEGTRHPDRNAQFEHINDRIADYLASGDPVLSADGKKKEHLGAYYREGKSWQPQGSPVRVRDHDFKDEDTVRVVPYGLYDIAANRGFVSVGTSGDTAAFAVNAVRLWWQEEGSLRYPGARRLLLTCDSGGSNDCRSRLWKDELAVFAEESGLTVEVCHFPPGTSKWNKIEHRLFCHITRTWRARPLMTVDDAVAGIAATVTSQGLKCHPVRDDRQYAPGAEVSDERAKYLEDRVLDRGQFHGEWNYRVLPAPRLGPDPEPARRPERPGRVPAAVLNHPALTGMPAADLTALAAALQAPFEARLQLDYRLRSGARRRENRSCGRNASRQLDLTDHLLALRLRDHLGLPHQAIAVLLGVVKSTATRAITLARDLLSAARITLPGEPPPAGRPRTPGELLALAAEAGIPLAIPENGSAMPERFITRRNRVGSTRPKQPTK